jgi:pyruvate formate lyase activating enzyme
MPESSSTAMSDAADAVRRTLCDLTAPAAAELAMPETADSVRCFACGHRCLVREGREGICKVRFNEGGTLRVPFGYVNGVACDPVEKKPLFHFLPGTDIVTFGMLGCDLHCSYCQNWMSSQVLRDPASVAQVRPVTPRQIVQIALDCGAPAVASSYNEPLITSEWAVAIFREARAHGLRCAVISNGHGTPQALDFLQPWIDAYKVDLKTFSDRNYRQLGGVLENVLWTIRSLHERGVWCELVTLLVPGFNDSADELMRMAEFIAALNPLTPWHLTAFHPDYRMAGLRATEHDDLLRAAAIGQEAGLRYIYLGNLRGSLGAWEDTKCHACGARLIVRRGFSAKPVDGFAGKCTVCGAAIPGVWEIMNRIS